MKNVTDAFKAAQASPSSVSIRRVSYKRRYWQQSTQSYIWETNWTTLSEADVVSVSAITAKLDTEAVNEFKVSNLTVTLKNADRRWTPTNPFGRFGKDAASPLYGYEPFWTKFRIETGYVVNGVDTFVPLFVGVAVDFQTAGHSDTMQVSVQGIEAMLQNASAENAGVKIFGETPIGSIDGKNNIFQTVQPGVGVILKVVVNGIENNAGVDYTIESLDDPNRPAILTFEIPPTTGQTLKIDYIYWKQQQNIEDAVKDILESSGFNSSQYAVEPVTFKSQLKKSISFDSQSDWESGTLSSADASTFSGSIGTDSGSAIVENFSDGNYTADLPWTVDQQTSCTLTVPGSYLRVTSTTSAATAKLHAANPSGVKDYGEYSCVFGTSEQMDFRFSMSLSNTSTTSGGSSLPGIVIEVNNKPSLGKMTVFIYGYVEDESATTYVLFDYPAWYTGLIKVIWRRWFDGTVKVYFGTPANTNLIWTGNHNGYTNIGYMFLLVQVNGGSGKFIDVTDIRMPGNGYGGNWVSPVLDFGSTPESYLPLIVSERTYNSSTITYQTRTSNDGSGWSSWQTTGNGLSILSPLRRYIQIKIYLDATYSFNFVDKLTIQAFVNQTRLKISKYTGKKAYDAIKSLASFANYEWGFGPDEKFFFRPKSVSTTIDQRLDTSENLIDVGSVSNGESKVYDVVRAEYGDFVYTANAGTGYPSSPTSRYGSKQMDLSNGDILIDSDTDVATGVARDLLEYYSKPRRTCKVKTKLMEWIDLSDTVSVTYRDQPNNWWMGDTHVYMGQPDIHLHGPEANTLDGFLAKVVGYRHDTESKTSEFDLEEIIQ